MMPAFLFEKVMCLLALSSMYEIWILRRALAAPDTVRAFFPPPSATKDKGASQLSVSGMHRNETSPLEGENLPSSDDPSSLSGSNSTALSKPAFSS